jgi:hypothetical protein
VQPGADSNVFLWGFGAGVRSGLRLISITNQALYQLSYASVLSFYIAREGLHQSPGLLSRAQKQARLKAGSRARVPASHRPHIALAPHRACPTSRGAGRCAILNFSLADLV